MKKVLKGFYQLQRKSSDEKFINDYNPLLILIWQANFDCQYIGETHMILTRYVTSNRSQAKKNEAQVIWKHLN